MKAPSPGHGIRLQGGTPQGTSTITPINPGWWKHGSSEGGLPKDPVVVHRACLCGSARSLGESETALQRGINPSEPTIGIGSSDPVWIWHSGANANPEGGPRHALTIHGARDEQVPPTNGPQQPAGGASRSMKQPGRSSLRKEIPRRNGLCRFHPSLRWRITRRPPGFPTNLCQRRPRGLPDDIRRERSGHGRRILGIPGCDGNVSRTRPTPRHVGESCDPGPQGGDSSRLQARAALYGRFT
jgi:hypothetical protein